jgi:hypothetical protein
MMVTIPNNSDLLYHVDYTHDVREIRLWLNHMLGIQPQQHDAHYLIIPDAWDIQSYHVVILRTLAAKSLHWEFVCVWQVFWCNQSAMCKNECESST